MKIRKASRKDAPTIRALIAMYPDKLLQIHLPSILKFFVAEEDDEVIGCCALEVYSKRLAEVRSLAVDARYSGKGVATQLVERCIQEARVRKVHEILTITGVTPLFEKQGFAAFKGERFALIKVLT